MKNTRWRIAAQITAQTATLTAMLIGGAPMAQAQPVYRCGESYSQQPCAGGRLVDAADPRSAEQRAQTTAAAQRDAQAATALEKDRLRREAQAAAAAATAPPSTAAANPAPASGKEDKPVLHKPTKPAYFTAVSPRPAGEVHAKKKKKVARRKSAA